MVVATGTYHTPRIPDFAEQLDPAIVQLHSSAYRNPSQLANGGVLVVGAANSGAEIAVEVSKTHPTWLSGRDPGQEPTRAGSVPDRVLMPFIWFLASRVLTVGSPIGRKVRDEFLDPPAASRAGGSAAGTSLPPGSSGSRGRPACATARRHSTTEGSWRSPTSCGAPGS